MNKLILLLGLVLVGCEVRVESQPQYSTLRDCSIEIEVMHVGGGENTIQYSFETYEDCYETTQRVLELSGSGNLTFGSFGRKILATNVASYRIKTPVDTY